MIDFKYILYLRDYTLSFRSEFEKYIKDPVKWNTDFFNNIMGELGDENN